MLLGLTFVSAGVVLCAAPLVAAQEPTVEERMEAVADALQRIADEAAGGRWQEADAAFNGALDAMDAHRPTLEAAVGAPAIDAFAQLDALLVELDEALRVEDPAQVGAVVGTMRGRLAAIAPGLRAVAISEEAAETLVRWRRAPDEMLALGRAGQWRDMRNAAIDLIDDVSRRGPQVIAAAGEGAEQPLKVVRVFAMRFRAAALDQSITDAERSARFYREAVDELLTAMRVLPAPTATAGRDTRLRFRVWEVESQVGWQATVPVAAEGIPSIGMGSYSLRVRWSPAALRLLEVNWDVGEGSLLRNDPAGTVELSLPQAPTGPSGDSVLARLEFEVLSDDYDVAGLLPAQEYEAIRTAIEEATGHISLADIPKAASVLEVAYARYMDGEGVRGTLYDLLEREGLAQGLADQLLTALDLASQPADVDVTVAALGLTRQTLEDSLRLYRARLGSNISLPVSIEVLEVRDTRGIALPVRNEISGGVHLAESVLEPVAPTVPPELIAQAATDAGTSGSSTPGAPGAASADDGQSPRAGSGVPLPLVVALLAASILGAGAVWWASRLQEAD